MLTKDNTFSITDLRHNTNKVLSAADEYNYIYLLKHSRKESAIVNVEFLEFLMQAYEDYLDLIEVEKLKNSKVKMKGITLNEFEEKYGLE